MSGVMTCSQLDLWEIFGGHFRGICPDLDLRRPEDIAEPMNVRFLVTFVPDPDVFRTYPNLEHVFSVGAGIDGILACDTLPPDVTVHRIEDPDQARQMAGFAVFHVLWHHRNIPTYLEQQRSKTWERQISGLSPTSRRVGILGFGKMGRAVAKALVALGYPVTALARNLPTEPEPGVTHVTSQQLGSFLAQSDILINLLPLTPETEGFLNAQILGQLPQGAALIHLGRGGHLDEQALLEALNRGHLSGASIDVFPTEPLPKDSTLWHHPRVLITPHVACISAHETVVTIIRDQLRVTSAVSLP